ncbi:MAG: M24 family metallopeptidase [Phycisphaerae bacterium]|nr:M24 family metallopeptidase [Phycisphaerae bacterium]
MKVAHELSAADVESAHQAAQRVVETHRRVAAFLQTGQTLAQIDQFVARTLQDLGCRSCFLGYKQGRHPRFPSHACLSVNDCVVHGTAGYYPQPLKPGDLLKVDIGVFFRKWVGDAAWTYCFGRPSAEARRLMEAGKESLRRGVRTLRPTNTYMAWAKAVQGHVEDECGFKLIRGLGGHGIGMEKLHGPPFVSNVVPDHPSEWPDGFAQCEAGTLVAVEPMLAIGTGRTRQHGNEWPVFTADGSLSVHYEHDVLITPDGPRVLTEGLDELPDEVG